MSQPGEATIEKGSPSKHRQLCIAVLPIRISSWEIAKQIERGKSNHHTLIHADLSV